MYRVLSVFSGCGGSDLGISGGFTFNKISYEKLPFEIQLSMDIDEKAVETLKTNFPKHPSVVADISQYDLDTLPDHDVLIGGFPCQSFSTVNPTKNPDDDRAQLYKQMVKILEKKKPLAFIGENVKGLFTLRKGEIYHKVKSDFENVGYHVSEQLINCADYGVPQKRQRLIIVGIRKDLPISYTFPIAPNIHNWVPLSNVIPKLALDEKKYYFSDKAVQGMKNAKNNMKRGLAQNLDEPCLTITSHLKKVSLNSRDPVLLVDSKKELYRRFTPREAASIQSFPDNFIFPANEKDAYHQIGNAIPPVMFWHICKSLATCLNQLD